MDTKELEEKVRKASGENADEILNAIKEIASVDLKIKHALEEIERIDAELTPKHNELADKINTLIEKVTSGMEDSEEEEPEENHENPTRKIQVKVCVVPVRAIARTPVMPLGLRALLDFLCS